MIRSYQIASYTVVYKLREDIVSLEILTGGS